MNSVVVPQRITQAIQNAAARTGSDFADLFHKAAIESGLNPNAKAKTSSATGLFQFTEQTWLHMIKVRGADYGLANYADHIQVDNKGKAYVSDPVLRRTILDMRQDPQMSAEMTCELDTENSQKLRQAVGGKIGPTELYLAHFLGAAGASSFLNAMRANPNTKAVDVLPGAAGANSSVFYSTDGQSRSVAQVYRHFAQKLDQTIPNVTASYICTRTAPNLPPCPPESGAASLAATMILGKINLADPDLAFAIYDAEAESAISILG